MNFNKRPNNREVIVRDYLPEHVKPEMGDKFMKISRSLIFNLLILICFLAPQIDSYLYDIYFTLCSCK